MLPMLVLVGYALLTHAYVRVWRSDLELWAHAASRAPLKPRPAVNLAQALIRSGQFDEAERWLIWSVALADQPHVPAHDREDALAAAATNLQTVGVLRAIYGR